MKDYRFRKSIIAYILIGVLALQGHTFRSYAHEAEDIVSFEILTSQDTTTHEFNLWVPYDGTLNFYIRGIGQNPVRVIITGDDDRVILAETYTEDAIRSIVTFAGFYTMEVEPNTDTIGAACIIEIQLPADQELILENPDVPLAQAHTQENMFRFELVFGTVCMMICTVYLYDYYRKNLPH